MSASLEYLKSREWSLGNGQCPDCYGVPASWHGHVLYMTTERIGHAARCKLAAALDSLGEKALRQGEFKSDVEFELFASKKGFVGTRVKPAVKAPRET